MAFYSRKFTSNVATLTAGLPVLIGPIDVSHLSKFAVLFQNSQTAIAFLDLQVQAAFDPTGTAADQAPNWVQINTATLPQPSALGATAVVMTSAVDNIFHWIRICGRTSQTAISGILSVTIAGAKVR